MVDICLSACITCCGPNMLRIEKVEKDYSKTSYFYEPCYLYYIFETETEIFPQDLLDLDMKAV